MKYTKSKTVKIRQINGLLKNQLTYLLLSIINLIKFYRVIQQLNK